jgi:RNA polymerase sigma-70 factor (sigma-E family)
MRAADEADFTAFVAAASTRLMRSAYLITGDTGAAEDLLQTALERAYQHWPRVRRRPGPEAYVRRILVNAAIDAWRGQRGLRFIILDESCVPAVEDAALIAFPDRDDLITRLRALPAGQRAVLVLRYFDDLTEAETARVLGLSVGTVKSQHARAIARLRRVQPEARPT